MADSIGTVVQGAHHGFYVYWSQHLGIDKEAFYLSARKNASSVELTDICLDTNTVVGYEEIGSHTGPSLNTVVKSTLLGGTGLGLLASSVSNNEEASFVVFLKDGESCTVHLDITWAVQYFRRIFVTKKGAGPNGSNMQQGGVARVSGDPKALLERAFMFLEDGDWAKADIYCESVLDQDPKCAEAYLGKLMAEVKVRKKEDLSKAKEPLDQSDNYSKVMRFADESLRESLSKAKELQHNEQLYTEAMACMTAASDEDAYRSASQKFLLLGSYKDSSSRREQCLQRADRIIADRRQREEIKRKEDIYSRAEKCMRLGTVEGCNSAIRLYESVPGFRSSAAQISECRRKIEEIKAKEAARQVAVEKAKKKAKKIAIIAAPIVCVCIAFVIVLNTVIIPKQKCNKALDMIESGDYEAGYAILEELGEDEAIKSNKYDRAVKLIDSGDYLMAYMLLNGLSYKDSVEKLQSIKALLLAKAIPGDTVFFGTYEQDGNASNGKDGIAWLVLDKKDDKALIISKYVLVDKAFDESGTYDTWEKCSLRKWLNKDFINDAFSVEEQGKIQITNVTADKNPKFDVDAGNATTNRILLLSIAEAEKYLPSAETKKAGRLFDVVAGRNILDPWWLRTTGAPEGQITPDSGGPQKCATLVGSSGLISYEGSSVGSAKGVRPAMWISLE